MKSAGPEMGSQEATGPPPAKLAGCIHLKSRADDHGSSRTAVHDHPEKVAGGTLRAVPAAAARQCQAWGSGLKAALAGLQRLRPAQASSEEHTSELQSLMR